MKKAVELLPMGKRTKAVSTDTEIPRVLKVVPQSVVELVKKLGFIDIRDHKHLTLTAEERLLLYIHQFIPKLKIYYPGYQVDEIQLESKSEIFHRDTRDYSYVVRVRDAAEITVPYSQWRKLDLPETKINRL